MENDTGHCRLFTGLEVHTTSHYPTLLHTSYADNLKFIKSKSHKDSLKTPLKLANKLATKEINQMACIHNF